MSILKEFKTFAMRGNVIDLAVGVVVGAAFTKIVSSLVDNIIMPPLGMVIGGVDFSDLAVTLRPAADGVPAVVWGYGAFVQTCVDFMIVAAAIFALVKVINRLLPPPPAAKPAPKGPSQEELLADIRDLLKKQAKGK